MTSLEKRMQFIVEADKLKSILRQSTLICNREQRENDAEHTWHLTLCAILLSDYVSSKEPMDVLRVLKMLIIHDMVEIEAGDTYCYDEVGYQDKEQREREAATNLFSTLPKEQYDEFMALWEEFEEMDTVEAKYASAIDRLQPVLQIYYCDGNTWIENSIDIERELKRNEVIKEIVPEVWAYVETLVEDATNKGWLKR
ncbi:HD domain-containing protein [Enterococcus gallinarum]|uniref:HD domain-containing protein n=1 Tax=Enterococcus gallinarum TaxID=1353 RepID=UPI0018ABADEF|nr:HD domain-containing protein [Enterococcus gallinarum]MDT2682936.1 HD domain-containing protein [Enterococcus gallinarum]